MDKNTNAEDKIKNCQIFNQVSLTIYTWIKEKNCANHFNNFNNSVDAKSSLRFRLGDLSRSPEVFEVSRKRNISQLDWRYKALLRQIWHPCGSSK